jgi:hypothetical protein
VSHTPSSLRPLRGERLLAACERARDEPPLLRPIALLGAALPHCPRARLLNLPLSERSRLLLELRRISFGALLEGYATCQGCGTSMEFELSVDDALERLGSANRGTSIEWSEGGTSLRLRQATTADMIDAVREPSDEAAGHRLLMRCLGFERPMTDIDVDDLPRGADLHFERLHADCELRCALRCPQCAEVATWELDPAHFIWQEVRHAAQRLEGDVHTLALHYGWSERSITRMSEYRRNRYLELLSA